jgi:hypothetical protein
LRKTEGYLFGEEVRSGAISHPIKIRVETIDYFLRRYREDIMKRRATELQIEGQLAEYDRSLRAESAEAVCPLVRFLTERNCLLRCLPQN